MSRCKSCDSEIVWVKMQYTGKSMPCDPGLIPFWKNPLGKNTVITQDGITLRCDLDGDPDKITDVGRIPHWITCPHANQHRRRCNG